MIDPKIVERMKAAAEHATPGPWSRKRPGRRNDEMGIVNEFASGVAVAATPGRQMIYADPPGGSYPSNDADHIAESNPKHVLDLIKEYESLRDRLVGL